MNEKEILEKYGDVELSFVEYYKHTFSYYGIAPDGIKINAESRCDGDDIYKCRHDATETLRTLYAELIKIYDKDGNLISEIDN